MIDTSSREALYASAEKLFEPNGPGRIIVHLSDTQIVDLVFNRPVDIMLGDARLAVDGALFVVPTPAGIIAVKRDTATPPPLDHAAAMALLEATAWGDDDHDVIRGRAALWAYTEPPAGSGLDLEQELRPGRHYRGWRWSPGRNALNRGRLPERIAESFR